MPLSVVHLLGGQDRLQNFIHFHGPKLTNVCMFPTLPGGMQGGARDASPGADYLGQKVDFVKPCANMIASVQPSGDDASNSRARRGLGFEGGARHHDHTCRIINTIQVTMSAISSRE